MMCWRVAELKAGYEWHVCYLYAGLYICENEFSYSFTPLYTFLERTGATLPLSCMTGVLLQTAHVLT